MLIHLCSFSAKLHNDSNLIGTNGFHIVFPLMRTGIHSPFSPLMMLPYFVFFSPKNGKTKHNGGIFAVEKGKARHKLEEIEAGRHMAKAGYHVTLKDETGYTKTPDGYVYSFSFEQQTPEKGGVSFKYALKHAASKHSDIAVIYDKNQVYSRNTVESGLKQFETYSRYRFKKIIVISISGNVYEHSHNI